MIIFGIYGKELEAYSNRVNNTNKPIFYLQYYESQNNVYYIYEFLGFQNTDDCYLTIANDKLKFYWLFFNKLYSTIINESNT